MHVFTRGLVLVSILCFAECAVADRPNFVLLIGDDIDRDCLGPWGGIAKTPHLDQLARDGIKLDQVYANVAMCAPFRQELYSGRCCWRTRAMPNHSHSAKGTKSLPHYLGDLGYQVGLIGKSHIGPKKAYPFDRIGELPSKVDANAHAVRLARGYVSKARDAGNPFCLVVASHDGHAPFTTGDPSLYESVELDIPSDHIDTPIYRERLTKHLAEVSNLDALLGLLRRMLSEEQLAENTVVIFCSEQGNQFPFSKWTCFNDGLASGVVIAWPDVISAGTTCDQLFWLSDIAPTLVEAAGGEAVAEDFDGRSQLVNLRGGSQRLHKYAYGAFCNGRIIDNRKRNYPIRCVRDDQFTLIWSPRAKEDVTSNITLSMAKKLVETGADHPSPNVAASWVVKSRESKLARDTGIVRRFFHRPEWALYDRQNDDEELTNLIDDPEYAAKRIELQSELELWLEKWGDSDPVSTEQQFIGN